MDVRAELSEWTDPRTRVKLVRCEPGLGTIYSVEGEGTCFHVLGLGFFTFLPSNPGSLSDLCSPLCRVSSDEAALAGLVLASRAHARRLSRSLEGNSDV
jgi:hypothetical protein